jgi:hypothetical protein
MVTLYRVTMKPFAAHGHATAKRDHATQRGPYGPRTPGGGCATI